MTRYQTGIDELPSLKLDSPRDETVHLYTDASVRGRFLAPQHRSRTGPAVGAWAAWNTDDLETAPLFTGVAYLGSGIGPQGAEYRALIHGLGALLAWVSTRTSSFTTLIAYTDNTTLRNQLRRDWRVSQLAPEFRHVGQLQRALHATGIVEYGVQLVGRRDPGHKIVHGMTTKQAWSVLLKEAHWRPEDRHRP